MTYAHGWSKLIFAQFTIFWVKNQQISPLPEGYNMPLIMLLMKINYSFIGNKHKMTRGYL